MSNKSNKDVYSDWVPYSTSSAKVLAQDMANGYVVYYNGRYSASPRFVKMLENQQTVYSHDVSNSSADTGTSDDGSAPKRTADLSPDTNVTIVNNGDSQN